MTNAEERLEALRREEERRRIRAEIERIQELIQKLRDEIAMYQEWVRLYTLAKGSVAGALALIAQGKSDYQASLQALMEAFAGERAKKLYKKGEEANNKMNDGTKNAKKITGMIDSEIKNFNSEISTRQSTIQGYNNEIRQLQHDLNNV